MPFNPDEYLASKQSTGFNPDAYLASKTIARPAPQPDQGLASQSTFMDRQRDIVAQRQKQGQRAVLGFEIGKMSPLAALQSYIGAGAGEITDTMGNVISTAAKGIGGLVPEKTKTEAIKAIASAPETMIGTVTTPEHAKQIISSFKHIGSETVDKLHQIAQDNPNAAAYIGNMVNIAALAAPPGAGSAEKTILGKSADALTTSAEKSFGKTRSSYIGNLVMPAESKKVLQEQVSRTTEKGFGPFKRSVISPSPREVQVAEEVSKIPGVSHKKTIQGNFNIISDANKKINQNLAANIEKEKTFILPSEVNDKIDSSINKVIAEQPHAVGNLQTTAERIATKAKQIISSNDMNASGLLKSRKEFDNWVRDLPGGGKKLEFDAPNQVQTVAIKTVRNAMNDMLDQSVKSVAVKEQLKRSNLLYDALDNIRPKAATELNTAIGRSFEKAMKILPARNKFVGEAGSLLGYGIIGGSAFLSPIFAKGLAAGGAGYGMYRAAASPITRRVLSKTINMIDKTILSAKDPSVIKQLRADRAVIVTALKQKPDSEQSK